MKLIQSVKHAEMTLSVERRLAGELRCLNEELEQRCVRQQQDVFQLREKIERMTAKLNEISQSNHQEKVFQLQSEMDDMQKAKMAIETAFRAKLREHEEERAIDKAELERSKQEIQDLRNKLSTSEQENCKRVKVASAELLKEREQSLSLLQANTTLKEENERLKTKLREQEKKIQADALRSARPCTTHTNSAVYGLHPILEEDKRLCDEDAEAASEDVAKQRSTGTSPVFFDSHLAEPSDFSSPASAMIKELLSLESTGEVLSQNQVLEISEKYARTMVTGEHSSAAPERFGANDGAGSGIVQIPTPQLYEGDRAGAKLRPSTELTNRFQRRKTPPKSKKERVRRSKTKPKRGKAHVKPKGSETAAKRTSKAACNNENEAAANIRQRTKWRY